MRALTPNATLRIFGLFIGLFFGQTHPLRTNVVLHYQQAFSEWRHLASGFIATAGPILTVYVASTMRFEASSSSISISSGSTVLKQSPEALPRFLPPSLAAGIEVVITMPSSFVMMTNSRIRLLEYRQSVAAGLDCHLLLIVVPLWLWTALYTGTTVGTAMQVLQASTHALPVHYWLLA